MEYFVVGKIQNTHGLKGELKIKSLSDFDRFIKGNKLYIEYKKEMIEVICHQKRHQEQILIVSFENLLDINLVEKYKGCYLYIDKDSQTPLKEDEFYYHELIGLAVYNQHGEYKGEVQEIREVPQGHLLVIIVDGKNKLVPFRKEFVVEVTKKCIKINEIEGLL